MIDSPTVIEGPVDPNTGYPSRLLYSPTRGVMGRLNADGSVSPAGAASGGATAAPAAPGLPVPPPGVDPKKFREELATRSAADAAPTATNELEFAQKMTDRQSYKEFSQALPTWNAFTQHVQNNSPAADKAIVDDFAKILNPGRAVTTGAFVLNLDAQSIPEELKATIAKWAKGDGELGPDARAQMATVAQEKMTQYQSAWQTDADQASKVANAHNLNTDRVIPQFPAVAPLDLGKISSVKTRAAPAPSAPAQGASDPLAAARAAIAKGAPRDAVIQRLQQNGIDPGGL